MALHFAREEFDERRRGVLAAMAARGLGGLLMFNDLRRTAAARIAVATPPHIVEALLNHRPPVLVRTYQGADRWEDKRAAWDAWSRDLAALVS